MSEPDQNDHSPAFWKDDWKDRHQYDSYAAQCGGNYENGEYVKDKIPYASLAFARQAARKYFQQQSREYHQRTGRVLDRRYYPECYVCPFCNNWHVGHRWRKLGESKPRRGKK